MSVIYLNTVNHRVHVSIPKDNLARQLPYWKHPLVWIMIGSPLVTMLLICGLVKLVTSIIHFFF